MNIRVAEERDCEIMMELIHELAVYEKAPNEVTVTLAEFKEAGFGKNPVWKAFVAEENEEINGFALYYIRYSTWKGPRLYLEDFIVTENKRRLGIGKQLFERVILECKEQKYKGMVWQVLDWNEPALNFYNKYQAATEAGWLNAGLSTQQIQDFKI